MDSNEIILTDKQRDAVEHIKTGNVLFAKTGIGKTYVALTYYKDNYQDMPFLPIPKLYVITTAAVRDKGSWQVSAPKVGVKPENLIVDSWSNIEKYKEVEHGFFVFDEQHTLGTGKWSKAFIYIAKHNPWIMLSATPGDKWTDYISLFIANGFYKNVSEFKQKHIVYNPHVKFPMILRYTDEQLLRAYRKKILYQVDSVTGNNKHRKAVKVGYDKKKYDLAAETRFNPFTKRPMLNASEYTQVLRRIVGTSLGRVTGLLDLLGKLDSAIIFYNNNYELDILRQELNQCSYTYAEYNGQNHDPLPTGKKWFYLVQYSASEGWNATTTNNVIFFTPNYDSKVVEQAEGRIDRMDRKPDDTELYYYSLISESSIDKSVMKALAKKGKFNERTWKEARDARIGISDQG
jgi:superfamily II DNA or RNA helicase